MVRRKRPNTLTSFSSRNKWARRGRNIAHFFASLIWTAAGYGADALIAAGRGVGRAILALRQRRAKSRIEISGQPSTSAGAKDPSNPFVPLLEKSKVRFSDVAGLDWVKEQIYQRMILPFTHPQKALALGIPRGGGVLIFGPPGVGKTMLAKAVAYELGIPFFHVKPVDILRRSVIETVARVDCLFASVRRYPQAVLFLDEAEVLAGDREKTSSAIVEAANTAFLTSLDGVEKPSGQGVILKFAATNAPWKIDPAFRRPGRFDHVIYVGLPDETARFSILQSAFKSRLFSKELNINELARRTKGYTGADLIALVNRCAQLAFGRSIKADSVEPINAQDFAQALQEVAPSVTQKDLERYQKFLAERARR